MPEQAEYHGTVDADGKLRFDNAVAWSARMAQFRGKRVVCTVEAEQPRRSLQANARYWAVLVPLAGHYLSRDRDVPLNKNQTHYILACAFGGGEVSELGVPIPAQTHRFTKEQFHVYCLSIESWLGEKGYPIPSPGEVLEACL